MKMANDIEITYEDLEWFDYPDKKKKQILINRLNTLKMEYDKQMDELQEVKTKDSWEWEYDDEGNEREVTRKLKTEIPDNPFDNGDEDDDLYVDDDYDDDIEKTVSSEDVDKELNRLEWKDENEELYEYLEQNSKNIEKGFYCYVVSQLGKEGLEGYMDGFRTMIKDFVTKKETNKIPKVVRKDKVTMDFKKKQIDDEASRLSNSVMSDLFQLLDMKD